MPGRRRLPFSFYVSRGSRRESERPKGGQKPLNGCIDVAVTFASLQSLRSRSLTLHGLHGASQCDGVPLLVDRHASLPRFDTSLGQRHVGLVAEGDPPLAPAESIPQRPRGTIASLFAQVQTITVSEQDPSATAMGAFDTQGVQFSSHGSPPWVTRCSYNFGLDVGGRPWTLLDILHLPIFG